MKVKMRLAPKVRETHREAPPGIFLAGHGNRAKDWRKGDLQKEYEEILAKSGLNQAKTLALSHSTLDMWMDKVCALIVTRHLPAGYEMSFEGSAVDNEKGQLASAPAGKKALPQARQPWGN